MCQVLRAALTIALVILMIRTALCDGNSSSPSSMGRSNLPERPPPTGFRYHVESSNVTLKMDYYMEPMNNDNPLIPRSRLASAIGDLLLEAQQFGSDLTTSHYVQPYGGYSFQDDKDRKRYLNMIFELRPTSWMRWDTARHALKGMQEFFEAYPSPRAFGWKAMVEESGDEALLHPETVGSGTLYYAALPLYGDSGVAANVEVV